MWWCVHLCVHCVYGYKGLCRANKHVASSQTHQQTDHRTHTHIMTKKPQCVLKWATYNICLAYCYCVWSTWLQPRFTIPQKNPACATFMRCKKWTLRSVCHCIMLTPSTKRWQKHSLTGHPQCHTHLWWITADSRNLFSHLPSQKREIKYFNPRKKLFPPLLACSAQSVDQCR